MKDEGRVSQTVVIGVVMQDGCVFGSIGPFFWTFHAFFGRLLSRECRRFLRDGASGSRNRCFRIATMNREVIAVSLTREWSFLHFSKGLY